MRKHNFPSSALPRRILGPAYPCQLADQVTYKPWCSKWDDINLPRPYSEDGKGSNEGRMWYGNASTTTGILIGLSNTHTERQ
jgi:hypothetical protein